MRATLWIFSLSGREAGMRGVYSFFCRAQREASICFTPVSPNASPNASISATLNSA
jgi:hypothetical protein